MHSQGARAGGFLNFLVVPRLPEDLAETQMLEPENGEFSEVAERV